MLFNELRPEELTERHASLVEQIDWQEEVTESQICSIEGLPWLGLTESGESVTSVIGFSTDNKHGQALRPPSNSIQAATDSGQLLYTSFNGDKFSRGVGELIVNDPAHMQPGAVSGRIAVRNVNVLTRPKATIGCADQDKSDRALFLRHGALTLASTALNIVIAPGGSNAAARLMELRYRQAPLVRMPIPPIWRRQQAKLGLPLIDDPGEIMLVRGREYSAGNTMSYAGSYPAR